jgi:prolyl-tRNA synthetase
VDIQDNLYQKALKYRNDKCFLVSNWEEFLDVINIKKGFAIAHWDGTSETEETIKNMTKATIRCIPLIDEYGETGNCVFSGKPSNQRVVFAKSY